MPILIRPSEELCKNFLSRPKTLACHFPTGWDFYFSMPFDVDWLHHMNPEELGFFSKFLWRKLEKITAELGDSAVNNIIKIQHAIRSRKNAFESLSPCQQQAWSEGYGVPIFTKSQRLVDFIVDCESIEFDQQVDSSTGVSMKESEQINRIPYCHTCDCPAESKTVVLNLNCGGDDAFEVKRNGATRLFGIYGGLFGNCAQWAYYRSTLGNFELKLLQDGELRIANLPDGSWELFEGPLAHSHGGIAQSIEVPSIQSAYQSSEDGPAGLTEETAPKATKYACPSCETDPGTSRTSTPAPVDPQEINSDMTENDTCDHCEACGEPRTEEDTANDASTECGSDISCFCTHWDIVVDMFGAAFETYDEWLQFEKNLSELERELLYAGTLQLRGNPNDGIIFIQGPLAKPHVARGKTVFMKREEPNTSGSLNSSFHPSNPFRGGCSTEHSHGSHSAPTTTMADSNPFRHAAEQGQDSRIPQQRQSLRERFQYSSFPSRKDSLFSV